MGAIVGNLRHATSSRVVSSGGLTRGIAFVLVVGFWSRPVAARHRPLPELPSSPGASQTPEPSPSGVASDASWATVDLPPLKPVASLEPTMSGAAGAAVDTAFRLRSLDASPVAALAAAAITVEPALALHADAPTGDTVVLRPASLLTPGSTYRFRLRRPDGTVAGSWSVVAARPLHVVGTLPSDESTDVPVNTGIEVSFDQTGVTADGMDAFFTIAPAVSGRFEVHGRVVAFIPTAHLHALRLYTLTVRLGLPLPGTGQVLQNDVIAQFETSGTAAQAARLYVPVKLADTGTRDAPAVGVAFAELPDETLPATLPVRVYRLGGWHPRSRPMTDSRSRARLGAHGQHRSIRSRCTGCCATVESTGSRRPMAPAGSTATHAPGRLYVMTSPSVATPARHSSGQRCATPPRDGDRYPHRRLDERSAGTGRAIAGARVTLGGTGIGQTGTDGLRITTNAALRDGRAHGDRPPSS